VNPTRRSAGVGVLRFERESPRRRRDLVAVEEPLEVRLSYVRQATRVTRPAAVTMRTPGDDVELSVGFLFGEGILSDRGEVVEVAHCAGSGPQNFNVVEVRLAQHVRVDESLLVRNFYVSSSCGVCGKASLDQVSARAPTRPVPEAVLPAELVRTLPGRLRAAQRVFQRTGGLHAAGLFNAAGGLVVAREDVGRHNAVDKVVGHCVLGGSMPVDGAVLVVSGRTSFEILQKAVTAGIFSVVAVGAPSSLAVALARRFGLTLVGFAREDGFNVYAGEHRIS
jgi:FdhD protein